MNKFRYLFGQEIRDSYHRGDLIVSTQITIWQYKLHELLPMEKIKICYTDKTYNLQNKTCRNWSQVVIGYTEKIWPKLIHLGSWVFKKLKKNLKKKKSAMLKLTIIGYTASHLYIIACITWVLCRDREHPADL